MTNPRDPDPGLEELLRNAMQGEADAVSPGGDGLARIQQRVGARRARRLWLRPVAVVGATAVAAAAGFTAYAVTSHPHTDDQLVSKQPPALPTASVTPTVSPSKTAAPAPAFPASAFYPFTTAAAEQSWEAQRGPTAQKWITDAVASARTFVSQYVLAGDVKTVMGEHIGTRTATVTLGRTIADATSKHPVKVTTVQLQRFGKAWLVVGAVDPGANLTVSSPASGATVTSPVTVSGPSFGVEETVHIDVRAIGAPFLTGTPGQASFGNGSAPWSATVEFTPPADPRGAVVLTQTSSADSGTSRIVATGVSFDSSQAGYPQYFYAVKDNRITKFSSRTGAAISYLTPPAPAGTSLSDPQVDNGQVSYISRTGDCTNELRVVNVNGGASQSDVAPDPGYLIAGYATHFNHALYETACSSSTTPAAQVKFVLNANDPPAPAANATAFQAIPPGIVGDPTWSDLRHLIAVQRTGTANSLVDYDSWTAKSPADATPTCLGRTSDGEPDAIQVDAGGNLWFAQRTGSSIQVVRCIGPTARVMFTVAGNRQPADLAVAGSGGAALVTDTDGNVWRWNQGGDVSKLAPSVTMTQLTW